MVFVHVSHGNVDEAAKRILPCLMMVWLTKLSESWLIMVQLMDPLRPPLSPHAARSEAEASSGGLLWILGLDSGSFKLEGPSIFHRL